MRFTPLRFGEQMGAPCACQNCAWRGPLSATRPIENPGERIGVGETCPAGECPACGSLAHLDQETRETPAPRLDLIQAAINRLYEACGEEGSEEAEALENLPSALNEALADVIRFANH